MSAVRGCNTCEWREWSECDECHICGRLSTDEEPFTCADDIDECYLWSAWEAPENY